ncbi:hypothetical protein ALC60_06124 [Trachymyrmex zeteki]|uniref:Uncharacterized protein n=1 Tax=Mycetomoellerius zeteki TaxID=64791 RepID=A0A151X3H7_9HYME|nr:hypothetical protein ALC60_06124 [Trachymyrmex zeteki]
MALSLLSRFKKKDFLHKIVTGDEDFKGNDGTTTNLDGGGNSGLTTCRIKRHTGEASFPVLRRKNILTVTPDRALFAVIMCASHVRVRAVSYIRCALVGTEKCRGKKRFITTHWRPRLTKSKKWISPGERAPKKAKTVPSATVFWKNDGHCLGGKRFMSNEVNTETEAYFAEFDKSYFSEGLKKWQKRWEKCILLKGDYVEK